MAVWWLARYSQQEIADALGWNQATVAREIKLMREARRPITSLPTCCSTRTRSGAWRGQVQAGAAPKEPPLVQGSRVGASEWAVLSSLLEVHAAKEVLEAGIGAQRVEPRTYLQVEEEVPLENKHTPGFIVE